METLTAVLENLPLSKPPHQTENNTSFHESPQKDVNQLNQNIIFKRQPNQEYNNQSQHHVVNTQYQKVSKQQKCNHYQKSKQEKRLYIRNLNKDLKEQDLIELFGFNATTCLEKSAEQKPCNFVSDTNSLEDDVVINEIVQHYSNHPSILKIREKFDNSRTVEQFQFNIVTTSEIYKLLKNIDDKNSISKGVFPDIAKIASVFPIDKQSDDKNKVSNFRPVSALNTFPKIYESVIKNQLMLVLNNIFSPYLAAPRIL